MEKKIGFKKDISTLVYFVGFLIFGLTLGLRDFSVGTDTRDYARLFEQSFGSPQIRGMFESGFVAYTINFKHISDNPSVYILSLSLLTTMMFYISGNIILEKRERILYLIFMVSSPFILQLIINAIRQGLAFSFLVLMMSIFVVNRKRLMPLGASLFFSYLVHVPTALNSIALIVVSTKNLIYLWLSLLSISLLSPLYTPFLSRILGDSKYTNYLSGDLTVTGFRVTFLIFSLMIIPVVFLKSFDSYSYKTRYFINCYYLINSIAFLLNGVSFANRFILISWSLLPFIYALSISEVSSGKNGNMIKIILSVLYFISCILINFL